MLDTLLTLSLIGGEKNFKPEIIRFGREFGADLIQFIAFVIINAEGVFTAKCHWTTGETSSQICKWNGETTNRVASSLMETTNDPKRGRSGLCRRSLLCSSHFFLRTLFT